MVFCKDSAWQTLTVLEESTLQRRDAVYIVAFAASQPWPPLASRQTWQSLGPATVWKGASGGITFLANGDVPAAWFLYRRVLSRCNHRHSLIRLCQELGPSQRNRLIARKQCGRVFPLPQQFYSNDEGTCSRCRMRPGTSTRISLGSTKDTHCNDHFRRCQLAWNLKQDRLTQHCRHNSWRGDPR